MEIKIKFDLLNEMLNHAVNLKQEIDATSKKIKEVLDDINTLIIIFIIGDGFI